MRKYGIAVAMLVAAAWVGDAFADEPQNLRGFGRVEVDGFSRKERKDHKDGVVEIRFRCETEKNAETVAGKFLWDLRREPDVTEKNGVLSRPGAAFAVMREGKTTIIFAAESRKTLDKFFSHKEHKEHKDSSANFAFFAAENKLAEADCPEYMKGFGWHLYGMGGFESYHEWMGKAGAKKGQLLDPTDDFGFLREMGCGEPMYFDNWLDTEGTDFATGILSPLWAWKMRYARQSGVPNGWRVYTGGANAVFGVTGADQARHAAHLAQPAPWLGCSMARRLQFGVYDTFHDEGWNGLMARRTYDAMMKVNDGKARDWMHPVGEIGGNGTARWHHDYGPAAQESWRKWLGKHGMDESIPIPEFATFAGLGGMVLDLAGDWLTRPEHDSQPSDEAWWKKPPEERYPGLAEKWYAEDADLSQWENIPGIPGTWRFAALYPEKPDSTGRKVDGSTCSRWFRRTFQWNNSENSAKKTYLYFMPLANVRHISAWEHKPNVRRRHQIFVNGRKAGEVGMSWGALDVTDLLREGENSVAIRLSGLIWAGRCFLSTEAPESYPFADPAKNRLWALWNEWRNESRAKSVEMIFDAMRQADLNAPIKMMAPQTIGRTLVHRLCRDWGAWAHFTGEGSWFFPWNKRYGRLWGIQGTSELAGPEDTTEKLCRSTLRVFGAGLDGHEPVFVTQTYSRAPELRKWWLDRRELLGRMGTYDIDLGHPQVLLYRRSSIADAYDDFPDPYPDAPNAVGRKGPMESPWEHDYGRGALQSIGQSFLYIDDDGLTAGKMNPYPLIIDCANEIIPSAEAEALKKWVEAGGTFVALPCTGRSTPPEDAAPIRALLAVDGAVRSIGKGRVVVLGEEYWRGIEDENGVWTAKDAKPYERLSALLESVGFPKPLVVADDPKVQVQPYRSNSGLDLVAVLCNYNEATKITKDTKKWTVVTLRTGSKPCRIVAFTGEDTINPVNPVNPVQKDTASSASQRLCVRHVPFDWDEASGIATVRIALPPQEVAVLNVEGVYTPGEALAYWWGDQQLKWQELKKPSLDLAPYRKGEWKDPVQDLKDGWILAAKDAKERKGSASLREIPFDILQFWGVPEGKGATLKKTFDVEDASWLSDGGRTWLVCGQRFGTRTFLTDASIVLNGEKVVEAKGKAGRGKRNFVEVASLLREKGNELVVEMADGEKYTGLLGTLHLYHREAPKQSLSLAGEWRGKNGALLNVPGNATIEDATREVTIPAEWKGKCRVRLWMEGDRDVPLGVRINGTRFVKGHDSNYAPVRDLDITDYLKFGEVNIIALGHEWNAGKKKVSLKDIRLDIYGETK